MEHKDIPYYDFESVMARMERTIERLWILCILLIVLLVGTNFAWVYYEQQYEDIVLQQEAETDSGIVNVNGVGVGNIGLPDSNGYSLSDREVETNE